MRLHPSGRPADSRARRLVARLEFGAVCCDTTVLVTFGFVNEVVAIFVVDTVSAARFDGRRPQRRRELSCEPSFRKPNYLDSLMYVLLLIVRWLIQMPRAASPRSALAKRRSSGRTPRSCGGSGARLGFQAPWLV